MKWHEWNVSDADLPLLAKLLSIEAESIRIRSTLTSVEAPKCKCGRQVGLLDVAKTALDRSVHASNFISEFFQRKSMKDHIDPEDLRMPSDILHSVNCYSCDEFMDIQMFWIGTSLNWNDIDPL